MFLTNVSVYVFESPSEFNPHPFDVVGPKSGHICSFDLITAETSLAANGFVVKAQMIQAIITTPLVRVDGGPRLDVV